MRGIILIGLVVAIWFAMTAHARTDDAASTEVIAETRDPIVEIKYQLPAEKLAKSEALYRTRMATYVIGTAYGLVLLITFVGANVGSRVRSLVERASSRRFAQAMLFVPLLLISVDVLSLPVAVYSHHLSMEYGLSVQGWASWFGDWCKGELINVAIATPIVFGIYSLVRRSPARWWFYAWLACIPIMLILVFAQPVVFDPVFNHFSALEQKQPELVPALQKVMQRGALTIDRSRMFEMQASAKVTTYNAYVTGIGPSKRVVVWDNTARDLSVPETMFIFAHEQGHYVLQHIWKSIALSVGGLFVGLFAAFRLLSWAISRYGPRLGIRELSDYASLPLAMLVIAVFSIFTQPINSMYSRFQEHQADIYALEALHGLVEDSSEVGATTFQKLGEKSLSYPNPNEWYVWWAFSHPPIRDRVAFASQYRPWDRDEPTQFVR